MTRAMIIVVSDDQKVVDQAKAFAFEKGLFVESYTTWEWENQQNKDESQNAESSMQTLAAGTSSVNQGAKILPFPGVKNGSDLKSGRVQTIDELENVAIENAIFEYKGNLTEAAKALGIGRATLYRKVKQYNIDPSEARRRRKLAA